MRVLIFSVLLLATAAVTLSMKVTYWGSEAEREAIISEAVSEAKLSQTLREQAAQASINSNGPISASMKLARGFKKASPRVQKAGKARIFMEDAVKRAERKLFELKKATNAQSMSAEARAEEIATELFHRPGRFLKEDELAKIYLESECIFERETPIECDYPSVVNFRTIDGTCNNIENIENATLGASETDFRRLIPGRYEDGISVLDGTLQFLSVQPNAADLSQVLRIGPFRPPHPSARLVSSQIIRDRVENEIPITHILMQWGQFLDHDLDLGPELEEECKGCTLTEVCNNIAVPDIDPVFGKGTPRNGDCLPFRRSLPSCFTDPPHSFSAREQINALTSFIDGSMVYGSTSEAEEILRLYQGGLLRSEEPLAFGQKETLPTIAGLEAEGVRNVREIVACPTELGNDCFVCGDIRCNEQISLTIMHTIWLREHNRLARELARINPHWDDERLFLEARAIVGAEIQKITYLDYLPIVLGRKVFDQVIGPFRKYNPDIDPSVPNSFATAAYRYGHSLVRPAFDRLNAQYVPILDPLPLRDAFFNPGALSASGGTDPILLGNVNTLARRVDESLSSPLTTQLFENEPGTGMDLAALNIQRSRDHGLPFYLTFRRFCQTVFPALEFNEIENDLTFIKLLQVYGSLETVELWVGGLAEERLPESLLGPTFACLFGLTFKNVRDGDRFYFESPSSTLSPSQIAQIQQTSLSSVICNNGDNVETIQPNAFLLNVQPRVGCGSIPEINLGAWRENACFARIDPSNTGGLIVAFSSLLNPLILETFTNQDVPECVPLVCPSDVTPSLLGLFVSGANFATGQCAVQSNLGLPSTLTAASSYLASVPTGSITPANGLYTTLKSCQKSLTPAFTFSNCLPALSAQTNEKCNPTKPGCEYEFPPGMKEGLDKYNALDYATTFEADDAVKENVNIDSLYAGEQDLLQELENELKQLSQ